MVHQTKSHFSYCLCLLYKSTDQISELSLKEMYHPELPIDSLSMFVILLGEELSLQ